ncbi:MAG: SURF1 family protein [Jatrophihabitantaceae bacterium]
MLTILRQPRYLGLCALMVLLAIGCAAAGTWQIFRFEQKHTANHHLRSDARDKPTPIADALGPADQPRSNGQAQKFRIITATGTYLNSRQTLLRGQSLTGGDIGYLVITPLRTDQGILLIARGFIPQDNAADTSPPVPAAPQNTVEVTGRLQPADTGQDKFGRLPGSQVDTVNAAAQAARIKAPVWNAYAELLPGQPGGSGLQTLPAPDLSNPAGGAEEPQHLAYVLQWYLFALLALAAPVILARAELRHDDDEGPLDTAAPAEAAAPRTLSRRERKASLNDRLAGRT